MYWAKKRRWHSSETRRSESFLRGCLRNGVGRAENARELFWLFADLHYDSLKSMERFLVILAKRDRIWLKKLVDLVIWFSALALICCSPQLYCSDWGCLKICETRMMDYKGWQMKYRPVLQELNSRVSLMMVSLMISQGRNPAVQSEAIRKSVPWRKNRGSEA